MADIIALKRELDEATDELRRVGQMNVAPQIPIEQRIMVDRAAMAAQRRFDEAQKAYYSEIMMEAASINPLTSPVIVS